MHDRYACIRKAGCFLLPILVLITVWMMPTAVAFASVFPGPLDVNQQISEDISTPGNASVVSMNRKAVRIATASDAEDMMEDAGESAEEEDDADLDEVMLLDDREMIATASNAAVQANLYPPQISVVVPTQMVILITPDGTCQTVGGSLENHGENAVLLTGVTFTWQTEGNLDADDIFTEWGERKPYAVLMLEEGVSYIFGQEKIGDMSATWDVESERIIVEPETELELAWQFELNGNCLNEVLDAGEEAVIASVIYTVKNVETS